MQKIIDYCKEALQSENFDSLAVASIDFRTNCFKSFEIFEGEVSETPSAWFDLASLTKPLTIATTYLVRPELFSNEMLLLLNHIGGLPSWGRLSKEGWREQLLSYEINRSDCEYSDYSALRLMLEIEKVSGKSLQELCSDYWDSELLFWKELPKGLNTPPTGFRDGKAITGVVNNDNAFVIDEFCSHAGLFATIGGVSNSLISLNKECDLLTKIEKMYNSHDDNQRFIAGWDRVLNMGDSLAGESVGRHLFGHLGFTGTSLWIDLDKKRGSVILSNATKNYWYDRIGLNKLRRVVGQMIWDMEF